MRRLCWAVLLAAVVTLYTFIIFFIIPTDTRSTLGGRGGVDPTLQGQFDLRSKSVTAQYVAFLKRVVEHGDLGRSIRTGTPVTTLIARAVPVTASLIIGGMITWFLLALPIGILSALRPRSLLDKGLMMFVLIGASAHPVWLGLILSYFLGYRLHLFPITGYCDLRRAHHGLCNGLVQWSWHLVLPWLTFAMLYAALYTRMIRASVLETIDEDYVRTARAKGASSWRVLRVHVLRNAMLPVVTMLGMDVGIWITNAVFIETVYGLPGVGKLLTRSLIARDLPVVLAITVFVSVLIIVLNAVV